MAIKEVLELIGDDVVIKKLENVKKAGEESLAVFSKPLPDLKFPDAPTIDSKPVQEFTGHISKLSDVLKILKPALSEAGVAVGGLGTFGRLANVSFAGLAAALGGAIVVKLADIEENAAKAKRSLSDLFGSTAAGEAAFKGLEASARSLHTTTADLLPGIESLARGLAKFRQEQTAGKFVAFGGREDLPAALSQNQEAVIKAFDNFFKLLRAGGVETSKATAGANEFFAALRSGGQLTADVLEKLPTGTVELLAQALGKGAITAEQFISEVAKAPISIDKVAKGLANFGVQSQKAFDEKAVRSYRDAWQDLLTTVEDELKAQSGKGFSEFLTSELDKASRDIKKFLEDVKTAAAAAKAALDLVKAPPIPGISAPAAPPTDAQRELVNKFAQDSQTIQRQNSTTVNQVITDWAAFSSRFDAMTNQIVNDSKLWTDSIVDGSKKAASALRGVTAPAPGELPTGPGFVQAPAPGISPFAPPAATQQSVQQAATTAQNTVATFQAADDSIRLIWIDLMDFIQNSISELNLSGATQALVQPFQDAVTQIQSILDQVGQKVQDLLQKLQQASSSAAQLGAFASGGGLGGGAPFASGGVVHGPGSTTSDSIMAWLSRGEYVVNARATSAYLPLLQAINGMRLPVGHFNVGGLARVLGNRFAGGGVVSSGGNRSLTLVLNQKSFSLTGSKGTIDDLEREASLRGLAMIGKAPSWIR